MYSSSCKHATVLGKSRVVPKFCIFISLLIGRMIEVLAPHIYGAHWVEYTRSQEGLRTLHFPGLRRREVATGVNKRYPIRSVANDAAQ